MKAVLATDLSAASEAAIQTETSLGCLREIGVEEMHLVTVVPSNVHTGMPGMDFEGRRRRALEKYRSVIEDAGFTVETHVVRGTPQRRINGIAETVGANLTVVGSRGKSPLENRIIGSTARNLARTTVVPLLVNRVERATEQPEVVRRYLFRRLLFATDFSENAQRAFDALQYLHRTSEEVTLVHVETPKDPDPDVDPETRLADLAETARGWGLDTTIDVRRGDPTTEILAAEDEYEPTTILLGSRGQSRLRRLLLGSVSEDIVARATGNIFLVPPPRTA